MEEATEVSHIKTQTSIPFIPQKQQAQCRPGDDLYIFCNGAVTLEADEFWAVAFLVESKKRSKFFSRECLLADFMILCAPILYKIYTSAFAG